MIEMGKSSTKFRVNKKWCVQLTIHNLGKLHVNCSDWKNSNYGEYNTISEPRS
jgi:hypothetical protein